MMKERIKQEKGVTLTILVATVAVLLTLTFTIAINTRTSASVKKLAELKTDIQNLRQKVSAFYNECGKIPGDVEYTNITNLQGILNDKEKSADSKFYVIDLQAMKGISLNYGRDYENVKDTNTNNANNFVDLYVVNNLTHNIFYIKGIEVVDNGVYQTHYTDTDTPKEVPELNFDA